MRQVFTSKRSSGASGRSSLKVRLSLFLLATLMCSSSVLAMAETDGTNLYVNQQKESVKGKVLSGADNSPIIGASVTLKSNSSVGTVTDADGNFVLDVPKGSVLEVSYLGYKTQDVVVGTGLVTVSLKDDALAVEDVVVTAMGIKKEKKALGYAVQDIKSDELLKNKDANLVNSLNGKIAGVNITNSGGAPGTSASIIIRGGTSLERDNQPLFIIDGMPMDNSTGQGDNSQFDGVTNSATTNSNRAMDINPEDVESISVLKGPAAAALYGLRAAAGAVIITTKKGKEGAVNVSFSTKYTNNWVNRLPDQQTSYKQGSYSTGTFSNQTMASWGDPYAAGEARYNNLKDFFQNANGWDNSISISGGTKTGNFYMSASRLDQGGVVPTTDFSKSTFRLNAEQKFGIFTFGANAAYSDASTSKTLTADGLWGSGGAGAMKPAYYWPANDNMKNYLNEDGSRLRMFPFQDIKDDIDNPYWVLNKQPLKENTKRFIGNVSVGVKVTNWMDINYRLGIDNYTTNFSTLIAEGSGVKEAWQKGMLSENDRNYQFVNSNLMLNLHKVFWKDWDFSLLLGQNMDDSKLTQNTRRVEGFTIPGFYNINNGLNKDKYMGQSTTNKRLMGVYGDFRVSYKNIAYLGVTGRNDWSSSLPKENRSFFYPSVSGSFVFTELLPRNNVLTFGKLRASWAQVGKDAQAYVTNTYLYGPELTIGGGFRNYWTLGNPTLKPETTTSKEIGTELRFLDGRLSLDYTYYINESNDQILSPRVSQASGFIFYYVNSGKIVNRGMELSISGTPVKTKNFTWDMTLNMSGNRGKVEELPSALPILYVTDVQVGNAKAASFNQGAFMGISGSKWDRDKEGNLILDWNTGYPTSDKLATYEVGDREPKFIGGFNNSLTYKGFNLSFLFDIRMGGDIVNGTDYIMTLMGTSARTENRNGTTTFTGVGKNPATGAFEPITREVKTNELYYNTATAPFMMNTSNFITDVNWLRLRSLSLSYKLPQAFLKKTKVIKGASITLTGTNLWLLTNYEGMDPEVSAAGAGVIGSGSGGIDYCGVPATAGFSVGLNINF